MSNTVIKHVYKSLESLLWGVLLYMASLNAEVGWLAVTLVVMGVIKLGIHLYHDFKLVGLFNEVEDD